MESFERAFELAEAHSMATSSYDAEADMGSSLPSPAIPGDNGYDLPPPGEQRTHILRTTLRKPEGDVDSLKSRKHRFSKRHSKGGLAAVF